VVINPTKVVAILIMLVVVVVAVAVVAEFDVVVEDTRW